MGKLFLLLISCLSFAGVCDLKLSSYTRLKPLVEARSWRIDPRINYRVELTEEEATDKESPLFYVKALRRELFQERGMMIHELRLHEYRGRKYALFHVEIPRRVYYSLPVERP